MCMHFTKIRPCRHKQVLAVLSFWVVLGKAGDQTNIQMVTFYVYCLYFIAPFSDHA
jgi:hypothetical protein